ncbi:MAG TPA: bifunctional [glutamine synthetase] adenylyltransferase/[glutamine synthetase]-adenylyl-L-tyrosine phosphorylase [Mycobacteriales bacterium]|nr:bifunctional [glutamine synthetase] adenylyltransferase/[glutamine synthetase]-adenylyl-L-tyrosine phosphorylase [Mycobacteriales bacterium]
MTERAATESGRLARLGFADPGTAVTALSDAGLLDGGTPRDEDAAVVLAALAEAPDPDLAATALARLLVADPTVEDLLRRDDGLRRRLIQLLGGSTVLGDHLVAHPEDVRVLVDRAPDAPPGDVAADLVDAASTLDVRDAVPGLRRAYRRALTDLAARDLAGEVPVQDVAAQLAELAAATLRAALTVAERTQPEGSVPCRLAVLAMGKCGGRELNYVSDVDVLFVAEPVGDGDETQALKAATWLASRLMLLCAEVAWPVDAALRPEGKAGPLVRTLASMEAYYRRWAKTWEFQALLKVRPVAGDQALGRALVALVAPMVWSVGERPGFVEDVQAMRRRVESTLKGDQADREVKLGPGGLRDIEFSVQLLQLVHGRVDDSLRSENTLEALEALATGGYVGREDARHLAEAYRWLRVVEHRLQLHRLRRTHLLPPDTDEPAVRRLARACGYRGDVVPLFLRERHGYHNEVRRLHEKLFYRPLLNAVARLSASDARLTPEAARERLVALGFEDPATALRHLEALTEGVSRRAAIQQTLLPAMLGWFADAADPDAGLLSFRQVSDALGSTPWYLRLLRDEGEAAERLARLLSSSRYLADLFARAPDAVRLLADDEELRPRTREQLETAFGSVASRREEWEPAVVAVRSLRRHELLRVAGADLLGLADDVGQALSDVTAASISAALDVATRKVQAERRGPLPMRLAVVAVGRLGGAEQGYSSDADVLFVHEPQPGAAEDEAASAAHAVANELRRLLSLPAPDPAVHVDADLRPEGRQGPLTRSLSSYAAYYGRWAHVWESQALLRAAPLTGDPDVASAFLEAIASVRYPEGGLTREQLVEVRRIKARVEKERLPKGADPTLALKLGRGGIADVEWTVQLLQLQHAFAVPALRTPRTLIALAAAREEALLDADDAATLERAWSLATRVRDVLVLVRGKPTATLPTSGRDLAGVARALGYPAGAQGEFLDDFRRVTRRARLVVEKVFYQ